MQIDVICILTSTLFDYNINIITMNNKDIYLVLHNVRSAYNVGSIFRTADAAGIKKIFLCGYTPAPSDREMLTGIGFGGQGKISKTALGAEKNVPWEQCKQIWRLIEKLNIEKIRIVALEQAPKSVNLFSYKPKFPLALIVGHERKGLSGKILNYVDDILEIPMHGKKESLNVSVAAGIALYELSK